MVRAAESLFSGQVKVPVGVVDDGLLGHDAKEVTERACGDSLSSELRFLKQASWVEIGTRRLLPPCTIRICNA